ncbi:MAG: hypothetical protein MJY98_08460 [Fibrobacter sp.]|nr:hypothetical protein [Fibrobacter sp.]
MAKSKISKIEQLKIKIAVSYGDDGIIDSVEKQDLIDFCKENNISQKDLEFYLELGHKDIKEFKEKFLVEYCLKRHSKAVYKQKKEALKIDDNLSCQWKNDIREKLKNVVKIHKGRFNRPQAEVEKDIQRQCAKIPVSPSELPRIIELYDSDESTETRPKKIVYKRPEPKFHPEGILPLIALLLVVGILMVCCQDSNSELYHGTQTFVDPRDGKKYHYAQINGVDWMVENLKYRTENSHSFNPETFGLLYPWTDAYNACPEGWRLPLKSEWEQLFAYVGGPDSAGYHLKASAGWTNSLNGSNKVGFSALPAGFFSSQDNMVKFQGNYARWWALDLKDTNHAWRIRINDKDEDASIASLHTHNFAISVRCIRIEKNAVLPQKMALIAGNNLEDTLVGTVHKFAQNTVFIKKDSTSIKLYEDNVYKAIVDKKVSFPMDASVNVRRTYRLGYSPDNENGQTEQLWIADTLVISRDSTSSDSLYEIRFKYAIQNQDFNVPEPSNAAQEVRIKVVQLDKTVKLKEQVENSSAEEEN